MGLFGSLVQMGFGGPPAPPAWKPVDLGASQTKAIGENLSSLPQSEELASKVNIFNESQIETMLKKAIPLYDELKGTTSKNIDDLLHGKLPKDVSDLVETSAASRSLAGGYAGSGAARNLTARDLGITSLNLIEKGIGSAESWMKTVAALESPGFFDVSRMFVSPAQQFSAEVEERDKELSYQGWRDRYMYNTDPMRGVEQGVEGIADMAGTALGGWLGGFGGLGGIGGGMLGLGGGGGASNMSMIGGGFTGLFGGSGRDPLSGE